VKISESMRFPHPVLWSQTHDFDADSRFGFAIGSDIGIDEEQEGLISLKTTVELLNADLQSQHKAGRIAIGLNVVCEETYFSEMRPCALGEREHQFRGHMLCGTVSLRPIAWAIAEFRLSDCLTVTPEFRSIQIQALPGTIVAVGDAIEISVGSDKHAPLASIFELVHMASLDRWRYSVVLEGDLIQIIAGTDAHRTIASLRGTNGGRSQLLNGVYLPALQRVIDELKRPDFDASARRWSKVLVAKLVHAGIEVSSVDSLEVAQRLMNDPLQRWKPEE
jgi:hypothetical protein